MEHDSGGTMVVGGKRGRMILDESDGSGVTDALGQQQCHTRRKSHSPSHEEKNQRSRTNGRCEKQRPKELGIARQRKKRLGERPASEETKENSSTGGS